MDSAPSLFSPAPPEVFAVDLDVFAGPFEVLLSLIARRKLDITEVALAQVTDEFIAFVKEQEELDLSVTSEFLVVAATLLALKAARLLPKEESEAEDLELLEERDLLFAKLLQYRAFKEAAQDMANRLDRESRYIPRWVRLEPQFQKLLPELQLEIDASGLAALAARALSRKAPEVDLRHLHAPLVSVHSQIEYIRTQLPRGEKITFLQLCAGAMTTQTIVSRFLAILELLRAQEIEVTQESPLAPLFISRLEKTGATNSTGNGAAAGVASEAAEKAEVEVDEEVAERAVAGVDEGARNA